MRVRGYFFKGFHLKLPTKSAKEYEKLYFEAQKTP